MNALLAATARWPQVVTRIDLVRRQVAEARGTGLRIGLVPTMGALHEAHVHLIDQCRRDTEFVVVSIFVNPTQFGPHEDYQRYPRTPEADLEKCAEGGASVVFAPELSEMYPSGLESTWVEVPALSQTLEGATRPGHFRGVATVVLKLLQMVSPDVAYFGEKDYQQLLVVRRLVRDLAIPVEIRSVATVCEADGLAASSRNRYLDPAARRAATVLYRALQRAAAAAQAGVGSADRVRQILRETIESEPLARLDYAEVADRQTLEPLSELGKGHKAIALVAAWVGSARLIDNLFLPD